MKCAPEHALSVLNPNSFVLKWKRVVSVLSPLSLFSRGGSHMEGWVTPPRRATSPTLENLDHLQTSRKFVKSL